jgi:acid phosphatase type 7
MVNLRFFIFFLLFSAFARADEPEILYLTWIHDPTTTMTIQWHTPNYETASTLFYRKEGESRWTPQKGAFKILRGTSNLVHTVELTELEPKTTYQFCFEVGTADYRFRTLSDNSADPLHFVVAGDAYYYLTPFRKMNAKIVRHDPEFIVIGGDIAYSYSRKLIFRTPYEDVRRWQIFFKEWKKTMITSDGRLIPMLPVLGNHDIDPSKKEVYFFQLFALPHEDKAYRALDIGNFLSFIFLDTGHFSPVQGEQTEWLNKTLDERSHIALKLPVYHVAAYPSAYAYEGPTPTLIRSNWVPLFESYKVKVAFEHHNHAFKRTYPIKEGAIDPSGVLYLGDGSWGVSPRAVASNKRWYIEKAKRANCFWLITHKNEQTLFQAFNLKGKLIDEILISQ